MLRKQTQGRAPAENRDDVRTGHVTIKMSSVEMKLLQKLVAIRRGERREDDSEAFTVSEYLRELLARDARRRRLPSKTL
jgi:hypothetical protein